MAIQHDEQGFLIGKRLGEDETLELLSAIKDEIQGLRGDIAALGDIDRQVATPTGGSGDAGDNGSSTADKLSLKSSLGEVGAKIVGAISETSVSGESDPSVQALNEVAQPLKRGYSKIFGGDKDKNTDRWYRRFWRDMRERKKLEKKHNKRQIELLEDIDDKTGVEGGKGGIIGSLLGFLGALLKTLLPLKALTALSRLPGLGGILTTGGRRGPKVLGGGKGGKPKPRDRGPDGKSREPAGGSRGRQGATTQQGGKGQPKVGAARGAPNIGRGAGALSRRIPILGSLLTLLSVASSVKESESDKATTRRQKDERTGGAVGSGAGAIAGMMAGGSAGGAAGAALGTFILPGVGTAVGGAIGSLAGAIGGAIIGESAGEIIGEQVGSWISDLRESDIGGSIISKWNVTTDFASHLWDQASSAFSERWDAVTTKVSAVWDTTTETISTTWDAAVAKLSDVSDAIVEKWDAALDLMKKGWSKVTDLAKAWWGSVSEAADKANDFIKEKTGVDIKAAANKAGATVRDTASGAWSFTKDLTRGAIDSVGSFARASLSKAANATGVTGAVNAVKKSASYATNKEALRQAMADAGITDPNEMAAFMGQMDHESGGLTSLNESFNYSSADRIMAVSRTARNKGGDAVNQAMQQGPEAVAELMYGGRMGNTNAGDGYAFRGRGFTQLTGRDNYTAASEALGIDLVNNPDMASDPEVAAKIATWYWQSRSGLSEAGKAGDIEAVTKKINGGLNGLADRAAKTEMYRNEAISGKLSAQPRTAGPDAIQPEAALAGATPPASIALPVAQLTTEAEGAISQQVRAIEALPPAATTTVPAAHPATPRMTAPTVPAATAVSAAPEVKAPVGSSGRDKPSTPGIPEVSRDLADRKIAHVVTGAYSQS